jgi:hypothetical protein
MRKSLFVLALLLGMGSAMAAPVNQQAALRVAENFWRSVTSHQGHVEQIQEPAFEYMYIFHVNETEGFVVVAADDCAYPILAYGTDDVAGEMGPETRFWLGQYEREIEALASGVIRNDDAVLADYIAREWNSLLAGTWAQPKSVNMVPALLSTRWNQSPIYNYYCPSSCPVGCVATAMAQVMKYWNHPVKGTGSHSYYTTYGLLSANFDSTYYDWANMPNSLSSSSTMQEIHAVAELSYHIGVAVEMDYSTDGSGASLVGYGYGASGQSALKNYFGYKGSLWGAHKSSYSDAEWIGLLMDEIEAGRPVLYAGYDNSAGHAFVFDGYNSSSQFHVNWGWGGSYNGFYSMGALNPGGGGVGTNTSNTFNSSNQALIGVEPQPRLGSNPAALTFPMVGGSQAVDIASTYGNPANWTATSDASWISLNPTTGSGNGSTTPVTVTVTANNSGHDRVSAITLVQGSDTVLVRVQQLTCATGDMCTLTVNAYDNRGNGWNDGWLTLSSTSGALFGEMRLLDGTYGIGEYAVCPDTVVLTWHSGSADGDCGFFVENADGVVWVNHNPNEAIADGDTFLIVNPCLSNGGLGTMTYSLTTSVNDTTRGYVEGSSDNIAFGESVSVVAHANEGYRFSRWNDGGTDNPRTLTVTSSRTLTARFDDLGTDTLHYDNGTYNSTYGGEDGIYWAICIPPSQLVGHVSLQSVKFYNVRSDYYTLNIHQGNKPLLSNKVYTNTFYQARQTRYRWVERELDSALVIDYSQPLWISLYCSSDDAPATASTWCGNDDGSWYSTNGLVWQPLSDEGIGATWMLRAYMPYDRNEYTLNVTTNNKRWGKVTGGGLYRYGQAATLVATPEEGYHFERWSDNNTDNPRIYYVRGDQTIRAIFAEGEVGIDNALPDDMITYVEGRSLFVRGADGLVLSVYDALGRRVYHSDSYHAMSIALPGAGVYVVRLGNGAMRKVVAAN